MVVGLARSGTTLLAQQLHSVGVSIGEETHVLVNPAVRAWCEGTAPASELFKVSPRLKPYRFLETQLEQKRPRSPRELLWALAEGHRDHVGYPLAGEKTPYHWKHVARLLREHPELQVIFCIRDVRDVIDSHFRVSWGRRSEYALAWEWNKAALLARRLANKFPDRVKVHQHEEFLLDPSGKLEDYRQWLGLAEQKSLLEITSFTEDESEWKQEATMAPNPKRAFAWKLSKGQTFRHNRYAVIAAAGLRALGYEAVSTTVARRTLLKSIAFIALASENLARNIVIKGRG